MTFWSLTLYDIYVPRERYAEEINKQKQLLKQVDEQNPDDKSVVGFPRIFFFSFVLLESVPQFL